MFNENGWSKIDIPITYKVYVIINIINNKQYIGQTKDIDRRITEHFNRKSASSKFLFEDINTFGKENFRYKILYVVDTKKKARQLEQQEISLRNTNYPKGYNIRKSIRKLTK